MAKKKTLKEIMQPPQEVSNLLKPKTEVKPTPKPLPKGFIQDPNAPNQMIRQLSPGTLETRNKPEETLRQQAIARERGMLVPPEIKPEQIITPEQVQAVKNIGLTPEEQAAIQSKDMGVGSSLKGIIPEVASNVISRTATGAAGGAIGGGLLGSVVPVLGTGIGAGAGAILGGVGGAISGFGSIISNLKTEEKQKTKIEYKDFTTSRTNIKAIIQYAKNGGDPIEAQILYDKEVRKIYRAEANLKTLSEREWLTKAKDELIAIQGFRDNQIVYDTMLRNAILQNPNVNFEFPTEEVVVENE